MIKRTLALLFLVAMSAAASAQEIRGAWTADASDTTAGRIHMQLNRRYNNFGQTMNVSSFTNLSQAQIMSATQVPVNFELRREAGTLAYEGTFKAGFGAGQFTFTANPAYLDAIRNLGMSTDPKKTRHLGKPIEDRLMQLAINDVSTNFIRSMIAAGYRVSLDDYLAFRIFNVTPELVRELGTLGYDDIPADELVESQIHRVTPAFIRSMASAGFKNLSLSDLKSAGIHGVTPEFITEMRAAGYAESSLDRLTEFRIHRVTPEFIRGLREAGYDNIPSRKLVEMKIHRVTPEFIRELRAAGYTNIPVQKLIEMKIHGVDAEFVKKMNAQ